LRNKLTEKKLDCILINKPENQFYVSGFTGGEGVVFVTNRDAAIITDSRYTEQAKNEAPNFEIIELKTGVSPIEVCANNFKSKIENVGFESHYLTYNQFEELKKHFEGVEIKPAANLVEELRIVKEPHEIDLIKKAQEITDKTFTHILEYIKPGVTERDLACEMEYFMKKNGADGIAFDTIVASGSRSSLPHGRASERNLQPGDFITMDFGARYSWYCSDMTRTVFLGRPDDTQVKIYNIVLEAQQRALEYIKSGLLGKDVDRVARETIDKNGYGNNFGHGLGHGVGIEIHESPRLSPKGDMELLPGMVVTVEPGIYIENYGGVRIEDLVVVTRNGCDNLTKSDKHLIIIN
jgi:Xaa-Pro aminopeptidase